MNQSDRLRSQRIKRVVENIDQRLIILWLPMKLRRLTYIWKFILSMTCSVIGWTFKLKVFNETIKELKEHEYNNVVCNVTSMNNECYHWKYKLLLAMLIHTHVKEDHAERKGYMWPVQWKYRLLMKILFPTYLKESDWVRQHNCY